MEPVISIPLERTFVGLAMTWGKEQRRGGLAMAKITGAANFARKAIGEGERGAIAGQSAGWVSQFDA
jgi:hypothetical protein